MKMKTVFMVSSKNIHCIGYLLKLFSNFYFYLNIIGNALNFLVYGGLISLITTILSGILLKLFRRWYKYDEKLSQIVICIVGIILLIIVLWGTITVLGRYLFTNLKKLPIC